MDFVVLLKRIDIYIRTKRKVELWATCIVSVKGWPVSTGSLVCLSLVASKLSSTLDLCLLASPTDVRCIMWMFPPQHEPFLLVCDRL